VEERRGGGRGDASTPAPTAPFEPVADLTIPDELNECLLSVLPERQQSGMQKKKTGRRRKSKTKRDRRVLQQQQQQDQQ
jgi:hypothetical protein